MHSPPAMPFLPTGAAQSALLSQPTLLGQAHSALSGKFWGARRAYLEGMLAMGFTFLELHLLRPDGTCSCPWYSSTRRYSRAKQAELRSMGHRTMPCKNPGKHPVRAVTKSVMANVRVIEAHLDKGGSVGLVLRLNGLPAAPLRLVVFDCDREGAREWLEARGITSPFIVRGKRGWHVYALLPADCPDLKSDTLTLNPGKDHPTTAERPGIDIKVSGHLVIPFSPNKSLLLDGQEVAEDPELMAWLMGGLSSLVSALPVIDPRVLVPGMKPWSPEDEPRVRIRGRKKAKTRQIRMRAHQPAGKELSGPLATVPYYERKHMAAQHLRRATPGKGQDRGRVMLRTLCALAKHYGLSEEDRLVLVMKRYNLRFKDDQGRPDPFRRGELHRLIRKSSAADAHSPFGMNGEESPHAFDAQGKLAKLRKRNLRSNFRRACKRMEDASPIYQEVARFIHEDYARVEDSMARVAQADLFQDYLGWTARQPLPITTNLKRFGQVLNSLGIPKKRLGHHSQLHRLGLVERPGYDGGGVEP